MKDTYFLIMTAVLGIGVGLGAFMFIQDNAETPYCQQVEAGLRANQTFNGSITCYKPSEAPGNNSIIENKTDLECLCQQVYNGNTHTFEIRRTR